MFGAISYSLLEIIWRGFTHWSMFVLGGLCFLLVSQVAVSCCGRLPLWFCCVVNTLLITGLEFVTGCVVNLGFGWNVWNYTNQPLKPDGTGLYRLHRTVVFAERSGDRACLPGAPARLQGKKATE